MLLNEEKALQDLAKCNIVNLQYITVIEYIDLLFKGGMHSIFQITILTFKNLFFIVFTETVIFLCTLLF